MPLTKTSRSRRRDRGSRDRRRHVRAPGRSGSPPVPCASCRVWPSVRVAGSDRMPTTSRPSVVVATLTWCRTSSACAPCPWRCSSTAGSCRLYSFLRSFASARAGRFTQRPSPPDPAPPIGPSPSNARGLPDPPSYTTAEGLLRARMLAQRDRHHDSLRAFHMQRNQSRSLTPRSCLKGFRRKGPQIKLAWPRKGSREERAQ